MRQRGDGLGFALESRAPRVVSRHAVGKNLDRDVAIQARVTGAIHLAHAAGANQREDLVWAEAGTGLNGHAGNLTASQADLTPLRRGSTERA